jgi:hypothetical protein
MNMAIDVKQAQETMVNQIRSMANSDTNSATAAVEFASAIESQLREVILVGDNTSQIFSPEDYSTTNQQPQYPLDILNPLRVKDFTAFVYPGEGRIPEKRVEGDYVTVPTYDLANAIDIKRIHARDAKWNVVGRMLEILESGIYAKKNDEGWQTILAAGRDRGLIVSDPNAAAGQFTPRLITALSTIMRRNGGGNSGSKNRSRLTDIYMSPEAHMDIRSWNIVEVPDAIRERIYNSSDDQADFINIFGVNLHALDEFGEGQEYQQYYTNILGGTMAAGDVEIVVGLDRSRNDSFVMPYREQLVVREDMTMDRHGLIGFYARMNCGFGVLDSRRVLLGSI